MSGSSCATTGSRTASSHPTRIFWITAAPPGISSPISHGPSCPSACATGHIGSDQRDPVLDVQSRHLMEGVYGEPFGFFRPALADELVRCEALQHLQTPTEVVGCDEVGEVL